MWVFHGRGLAFLGVLGAVHFCHCFVGDECDQVFSWSPGVRRLVCQCVHFFDFSSSYMKAVDVAVLEAL